MLGMEYGELTEITTNQMIEMFGSVRRPKQMKLALIQFKNTSKLLKFGGTGYYDFYTGTELKFNIRDVNKVYYLNLTQPIGQNDLLNLILDHQQSNETAIDVIMRIFEVIDN